MTAINVIRQSDMVHVLADGLAYGPPGQSLFPSAKLWPQPGLPAIIALRGPKVLSPFMADVLGSAAGSYDALKASAPAIIRAYLPQITAMLRENPEPTVFDVVVAGITQDNWPDSFFVCTHDRYGIAPWVVHDLGDLQITPANDAIEAEVRRAYGGRSSDDLDPVADGIKLFEIQRAAWPDADRPPGGFLQLMTIHATGLIETALVNRWAT